MPFIPHAEAQQDEMLAAVGTDRDGLFADIPPEYLCDGLNLPDGVSEQEASARLRRIADQNARDMITFLGGGFYDHYIPAAVERTSNSMIRAVSTAARLPQDSVASVLAQRIKAIASTRMASRTSCTTSC